MDNQNIFELLKQLGVSGDLDSDNDEKERGKAGISGYTGEVLDRLSSDGSLNQDEMTELIYEMTSGATEEQRQELKEFIKQTAQQLDNEELSGDLLRLIDLFLNQD